MSATDFVEDPLMYELVVVGAGPAGLASALFAAGQRIKVVVVAPEVGGQALHSTHVENYMGFDQIAGTRLVERFEQQIRDYYIEHIADSVAKIAHPSDSFALELQGGGSVRSRSVLVVSGMVPNRLGVPGESEFTGRGVSYFADHYGPTRSQKERISRRWRKLGPSGRAGGRANSTEGAGDNEIRLDRGAGQD